MTRQPLHVIYIPGLGDYKVSSQLKAIKTWKWWGVEPQLFQMNWHDAEPWEPKLGRLLTLIDSLAVESGPVGLVGASAGAAAVITAYAARRDKIAGCVLICGKVNRPDAIGQRLKRENPAFISCAYQCEKALIGLTKQDKSNILSYYAFVDEIVSREDSYIPGANNHTVPSIGHAITIALKITLGAPGSIHFLKRCYDRPSARVRLR